MPKKLVVSLVALSLLIFLPPVPSSASLPSDVLFLAHFDSNTKNEVDGQEASVSGLDYRGAKYSQGVHVADGGKVDYNNSAYFNYAKGTVEFWVKFYSVSDTDHAILVLGNSDGTSLANSFEIFRQDNIIGFHSYDSTGTEDGNEAAAIFTNQTALHFVAVTWDYSTASFVKRLYIDGVIYQEVVPDRVPTAANSHLFVGTSFDLTSPARGTIDELLITSSVKSEAEIAADFNLGAPFYTSVSTNPPQNNPVSPTKPPSEKTPPTIKIDTDLAKPFQTAPTISGSASDNEAVESVEYSTDQGNNWLPVDTLSDKGKKTAQFSFKPNLIEDGNYRLEVRATDSFGNVGLSGLIKLVIDRLPPLVGSSLVSLGPEVLEPDEQGWFQTAVGAKVKISLPAAGGPTSVVLQAQDEKDKDNKKSFNLGFSKDPSLWTGILNFTKPGFYRLSAQSVDGAGNKTVREVAKIAVSSVGRLIDRDTKEPISKGKVTLYYFEPENNTWVVWDGVAFRQTNPQDTDESGAFNLLVPAGKYYLQAEARGYRPLSSDIFELKKATALTADLALEKSLKIGGFGLPWPLFSTWKVNLKQELKKAPAEPNFVGQSLPDFTLESSSGTHLSGHQLTGKFTLISFVSTWSPAGLEQLSALANLQVNKDINIVPIVTLESLARVKSFKKIGGYTLDFLVDPDGKTVGEFNLQFEPTHLFVTRSGVIKRVLFGVLSKEELLSNLVEL